MLRIIKNQKKNSNFKTSGLFKLVNRKMTLFFERKRNMMQIPTLQTPQSLAPSYNAVKIDVHNPQVNVPGYVPTQGITSPYTVPTGSVYELPQQSVYGPQQNVNAPQVVQEAPPVPQPVIVTPTVTQTPANQPVNVKAPEPATTQVDLNAFLGKLSSENFEEQANAMESIADLAQNSPQKATELLDVKVIDSLLNIMNKDSSKLAGPTPKQLELREKIINKQTVTDAESAEANTITPMEQAERNKQYAMYTTAILQKLYASEIKKLNNAAVPLTELPGAAGIVEQVKNNPNPMVRASGIDALSYIQAPEYKQDLTTLFTISQKDKDTNVQEAAKKALEKLAQVEVAPSATASAPAQPKTETAKAA